MNNLELLIYMNFISKLDNYSYKLFIEYAENCNNTDLEQFYKYYKSLLVDIQGRRYFENILYHYFNIFNQHLQC